MSISQYGKQARLNSIKLIESSLNYNKIDLSILGLDYFVLQPETCTDCIGSPEMQREWHVHHIGMCLKTLKAIDDFQNTLIKLIIEKSKKFDEKKQKVVEKIKHKAQEINYKDKIGEDYLLESNIINCRNSKALKKEEKKHLTYLENLANSWQKKSEAERKETKNQEEQKNNQEQQKNKEEEENNKKQEEELKQKQKKFEEEVREENNQPTNSENENNNLPSPTNIQNNYNSDKDKSEIENNPCLTNPEKKDKAQELLKLIITAELLIKETKFDSETLFKLIQEKEQNTETYQLLKERIEQAINQLSSIQPKQNNNNEPTPTGNKPSSISPSQIFTIGGVVALVIMIVVVGVRKVKKNRPKVKKIKKSK